MSDHSCTDAAEQLGVSRSWLSGEAAAKRVPHYRYGAPGSAKPRYVFSDDHIAQIRQAREVRPTPVTQLPVNTSGRRGMRRAS